MKNYYLIDLVKDKKVSIVGPASYLKLVPENLNKINEADIIVRINRGMTLVEGYSELVGERTDILYNCMQDNLLNGGVLDVEFLTNSSVIHIRALPWSDHSGNSPEMKLRTTETALEKIKLLQEKGMMMTMIDNVYLSNLGSLINCRPTTGYAALMDLIFHNPKSIHVSGFSFYLGGVLEGYFKSNQPGGIEDIHGRTEKEEAERNFNSTRHVHKNMWRLLKDIHDKIDVDITFDPILEKIINLKEYSKTSYQKIIEDFK